MGSTYVYKSKWLSKRRWDVDFGCFYTSIFLNHQQLIYWLQKILHEQVNYVILNNFFNNNCNTKECCNFIVIKEKNKSIIM